MNTDAATDQPHAAIPLRGGVVPYLMLQHAARAICFYKTALGAQEVGERDYGGWSYPQCAHRHQRRLGVVMDRMPEHGHPAAPHDGFNLHLHLNDADLWFERAAGGGCTVVMPLALQFWGDRYGMV